MRLRMVWIASLPRQTEMRRLVLLLVMLAVAVTAGAHEPLPPQSTAQDFVVTLNDSPNGLIIDVDVSDSGERLFSAITDSIALNGDVFVGRMVALMVTSQNSGPRQPIASGAFLIMRDKLFSDHTYIARVHRACPDEMQPVPPAYRTESLALLSGQKNAGHFR